MSELSDYRRIVSDPLEAQLRLRIAKITRERDEAVRLIRAIANAPTAGLGCNPEGMVRDARTFLATVEGEP